MIEQNSTKALDTITAIADIISSAMKLVTPELYEQVKVEYSAKINAYIANPTQAEKDAIDEIAWTLITVKATTECMENDSYMDDYLDVDVQLTRDVSWDAKDEADESLVED